MTLTWLAIGVITIVIEFFVTPGIGVVFIGMGALTTGALIEAGVVESFSAQLAVFSAATVFWALLLWKPLKNLVKNKGHGKNQSHIIGTDAVVAKGGVSKLKGSAKWSGTEMAAKLAPDAEIDELKEGTLTTVVALDGSTLILTPKK